MSLEKLDTKISDNDNMKRKMYHPILLLKTVAKIQCKILAS